MPAPWVVSDFDDCEIISASIPSRRKPPGGTKRPLSSLSQDSLTRAPKDKDQAPWLLRYAPKSVSELVVAKAKIAELTDYLSNNAEPRIILLYGPPGCGKSATLRCVADSLGFKIREWSQPSSETRKVVQVTGDVSDEYDGGISRAFCDFILNSTSYQSLLGKPSTVVTVIEEMPSFRSELCPESIFHEVLRQSASSLRQPICFILTSNVPNSDPPEMHRLFPQKIRDELRIRTLSFNPIPPRSLTKMLNNILVAEKVSAAFPPSSIQETTELCGGDMRVAINNIQFLCHKFNKACHPPKRPAKERKLERPSSKSSRDNRKSATPPPNDSVSFDLKLYMQSESDVKANQSHSLLLFRALGRVLYSKREPPTTNVRDVCCLPSHLKEHETDALSFDPVSLLRHCPVAPSTFVGFLQHNVTGFYTKIDDLAVLYDGYLSICDLIFSQWDSSMGNSSEVASMLAVYAVVHCNSRRRKYLDKEQDGSSAFRPMHAPPSWNTQKAALDCQKNARSILPDYLAVSSSDVIADYISFSGKLLNTGGNSQRWLKDLKSGVGEFRKTFQRPTALSTGAMNFKEDSGVDLAEQFRDSQNYMPDDELEECKAYNESFLRTIEEDY